MNSILFYSSIYLIGVIISSFAQLLLKKASNINYDNKLKEYLNFKTLFAYLVFFSATLFSVYSYKGIPLSLGPILGTTEYIFITILSIIFLKEKISKNKILGLTLVLIGIFIYFI